MARAHQPQRGVPTAAVRRPGGCGLLDVSSISGRRPAARGWADCAAPGRVLVEHRAWRAGWGHRSHHTFSQGINALRRAPFYRNQTSFIWKRGPNVRLQFAAMSAARPSLSRQPPATYTRQVDVVLQTLNICLRRELDEHRRRA